MPTIGIVDDREDVRRDAEEFVREALDSLGGLDDWIVVASAPLPALEHYASWIAENEIAVLLLDQTLTDAVHPHVDYSGNDIVGVVCPRQFDLPVYYLTAAPLSVPRTKGEFSRVRGVIDQNEFFKEPEHFVKEFVQAGSRYVEQVTRLLLRLSEIAEAAVNGSASSEDVDEASAIRMELSLPFETSHAKPEQVERSRAKVLDSLETELKELAELRDALKAALGHEPGASPKRELP
jgi:hypothetical protein